MDFEKQSTKIIPKNDFETESQERIFNLLATCSNQKIRQYQTFLKTYGGGLIFPNTIDIPRSFKFNLDDSDAKQIRRFDRVSSQSLLGPTMILEEYEDGIDGVEESELFLVVARSDTVAEFHISLKSQDAGTIYYWEPYGDGVHFIHQPIATDFIQFLKMRYYHPEMGMTLPWRDMHSINAAPAIDLDISQLAE